MDRIHVFFSSRKHFWASDISYKKVVQVFLYFCKYSKQNETKLDFPCLTDIDATIFTANQIKVHCFSLYDSIGSNEQSMHEACPKRDMKYTPFKTAQNNRRVECIVAS